MPIQRTPDIGGFETRETISGDYTANPNEIILADASGGDLTVTLPPVDNEFVTVIKRTDTSSNTVTIATPNSENIDGSSNFVIGNQYDAFTITSDGSNYFIV